MLCISLAPGEYFKVGDNVVIQYDNVKQNHCHLAITAPRDVKVLRGELLEKAGEQRPGCVFDKPSIYYRELPWNRSKAQSLGLMRKTLDGMEDSPEVRTLKRQLDHIFNTAPPGEAGK